MAAEQKSLHILTEGLGVVSGITLISLCNKVPEYRGLICTIGIATVLVDLYFISTWINSGSSDGA